ncbi:M20 family peptidase [Desulfobacter hydrogenophilus]|uniref:Peptidase M20 domain-containing protein 2 n=1 Tax=Desulfobacter hydrogenophilus TaxID=2291 RepID=A0A328FBX9_9BACT|nr:M20 family metallopeptidase [Desulfobacter hydrogenophilus]NDY72366.1 M20 family metallopeptidase [Desulfobacter hydrogenophilus]QBH13092.1 M20 family peptidase [Desulfobacter hydrogenophilus]RAM01799.1 M20 family peptidase [Desulfobacter hydrogenophilus]
MTTPKKLIRSILKAHEQDLLSVVRKIHETPELSEKETWACAWQADLLNTWGFSVETGYKGLATAFNATAGQNGPHICFMSEYDALPGIGHGCGHNLIAGVALGGGVVLKNLLAHHHLSGRVTVMGTPAEEQRGAKIDLIKAGALKNVDLVLMAHPSDDATAPYAGESGIRQFMVSYTGKTAHAADCPEKGVNALDAVRLLFNGVDAWRQQLTETSRVHGVIRDGGQAPNIIPDFSRAEFYLRDFDLKFLDQMQIRFENIAKGAALMTDTMLTFSEIPNPYKPGIPNDPINQLFFSLARDAGMQPKWARPSRGSSDFGDVTYEVPAMHAYFNITQNNPGIIIHSREFAQAAATDFAFSQMKKTARILAQIAWQFLTEQDFRQKIQKAFPFSR